MFNIFKNNCYPIGIELGPEKIRMAQLASDNNAPKLVAGSVRVLGRSITPYNAQWQRSAIETIKMMYDSAGFRSKNIVTAIHPSQVFSREIKVKTNPSKDMSELVKAEFDKIAPFQVSGALVKHIVLDDKQNAAETKHKDVLVMATEKSTVEKHLAVFEKASLKVRAITVWPSILTQCYVNFFGRRHSDADVNVLLLNAAGNYLNAVICRQKKVLFARTIAEGLSSVETETGREKLTAEINACIRYFQTSRRKQVIEKIILFAGAGVDSRFVKCIEKVAESQSLPALCGDVLKAVSYDPKANSGVDRRELSEDWTIPFGLSLAAKKL